MITLTNSATSQSISLDVSYNSQESSRLFINRGLSQKGFDYHFSYGQKKEYSYEVQYATWSDARLVNEWWENNQRIFLSELDNFNEQEVMMSNQQNPFSLLTIPYQDQYNQQLNLIESGPLVEISFSIQVNTLEQNVVFLQSSLNGDTPTNYQWSYTSAVSGGFDPSTPVTSLSQTFTSSDQPDIFFEISTPAQVDFNLIITGASKNYPVQATMDFKEIIPSSISGDLNVAQGNLVPYTINGLPGATSDYTYTFSVAINSALTAIDSVQTLGDGNIAAFESNSSDGQNIINVTALIEANSGGATTLRNTRIFVSTPGLFANPIPYAEYNNLEIGEINTSRTVLDASSLAVVEAGTYLWSLVAEPAGSSVTLDANSSDPFAVYTPTHVGSYVVELVTVNFLTESSEPFENSIVY